MSTMTTAAGFEQMATQYFTKKAESRLVKEFQFYKACDKRRISAKSGKTVQFYRFDNVTGSTATLTEGTLTAGSATLSARSTNLTLNPYGQFITVSEFAELVERADFMEAAADVLTDAALDTVDLITKGVLDSNAAAFITNSATPLVASTSAALTSSDKFDSNVARAVKRELRKVYVKEFRDGMAYLAFIGPDVCFDMTSDSTVGGFLQTHQYAQPKSIISGELGKLNGIRYVESAQIVSAGSASDGTVLYPTYILGQGTLVAPNIMSNPIKIIRKGVTSGGVSNPYENIETIAYKLPAFGVSYQGGDAALVKTSSGRAFRVLSAASA